MGQIYVQAAKYGSLGKMSLLQIFLYSFMHLLLIYIMGASLCVAKRRPLFWNICPCFLIYLCVLSEAGNCTAISEIADFVGESHREVG